MDLMQPLSKSRTEYVETLWKQALLYDKVYDEYIYDEYILKGIITEGITEIIRPSVHSYRGSKENARVHSLPRHLTWFIKFQHGLHNTETSRQQD